MDINTLVKVTSRAWALNILALMHAGTPGRQASLLSATGAGRTAFAQSLSHLIDLKLLERNAGHGHPLRPEYRLTSSGMELARMAEDINQITGLSNDLFLLRRAWTIPILAVSQEPLHFSEFKDHLGTITDRALSQSLKQLEASRWLNREIDISRRPVRPLYQAANVGAQVSDAIGLSAH